MEYLIPALLTAIFAFVVGFLLWQIKRERISLEYDCIGSETFPREKGFGRYFIIKFLNSGNRSIENTKLTINFQLGKIESVNFSDLKLINDVSIEERQLTGSILLLNPKENLGVTITTIGEPDIGCPTIKARAVGVTAVPKKKEPISNPFLNLFSVTLVVAVCIAAVVSTMIFRKQAVEDKSHWDQIEKSTEQLRVEREKAKKEFEQGKPEREQIVFAILNRAGLGHLMYRLIETGDEVTYWKTGLVLMQAFLVDQKNSNIYITAMKSITEIPDIAPSSLGFNLYLLGKMEQSRGKNDKAMEYFEKCKAQAPLMYEHLMTQDPAYDLESLRKWMLKKSKQ